MRNAFVNALTDLAERNKDVFLLTGDLGFSFFESYQHKFPARFINMGVAEQNMIGVAAGLALSGKSVFVYSIVPFLTMRCFEQIRLDLCCQRTNVKLVGAGGGLTYGSAGVTHLAMEDISIMRSLPGMCVICPGDARETDHAVRASLRHRGPVYIRLSEKVPSVHSSKVNFRIGKGITVIHGDDVNILVTGNMLMTAMDAAQKLKQDGVSAGVISIHTIKPLDVALIKGLAARNKPLFTLEEHSVVGGLGSAVSEVLTELGSPVLLKRIGLPDAYPCIVGSQGYLRKAFGLDAKSICSTIRKVISA